MAIEHEIGKYLKEDKINEGEMWDAIKDVYKSARVSEYIHDFIKDMKAKYPNSKNMTDEQKQKIINDTQEYIDYMVNKSDMSPEMKKLFSNGTTPYIIKKLKKDIKLK